MSRAADLGYCPVVVVVAEAAFWVVVLGAAGTDCAGAACAGVVRAGVLGTGTGAAGVEGTGAAGVDGTGAFVEGAGAEEV